MQPQGRNGGGQDRSQGPRKMIHRSLKLNQPMKGRAPVNNWYQNIPIVSDVLGLKGQPAQPLSLVGGNASRAGGGRQKPSVIQKMREYTRWRPNWNLFVGDPAYTTNFFLQFNRQETRQQCEFTQVASSLYSIRCLIILIFVINMQFNWSSLLAPDSALQTDLDGLDARLVAECTEFGPSSNEKCYNQATIVSSEGGIEFNADSKLNMTSHDQVSQENAAIGLADGGNQGASPIDAAPEGYLAWLFGTLLPTFICVTISILGTYRKDFPLWKRQLMMNAIVAQVSQNIVIAYNLAILEPESRIEVWETFLVVLMLLPGFLLNLLILVDWPYYLVIAILQMAINGIVYSPLDLSWVTMIIDSRYVLLSYALLFSIYEKVQKEHFVINVTNEKSRKILLQVIDQTGFASCLVTQAGNIIFFNECFERLVLEKLKEFSLPENIYKLTEGDEQSTTKLQELFAQMFHSKKGRASQAQPQGNAMGKPGFSSTDKSGQTKDQTSSKGNGNANGDEKDHEGCQRKIEIRLTKNQASLRKPLLAKPAPVEEEREDKGDGKSNNDKSFFSNFEMVRINASPMMYKGQSALILSFFNISDHKAQTQMMYVHLQLLSDFVQGFKNKVETSLVSEKASDTGSFTESLTETLGGSYLMINNLRQMQHQLQFMSNNVKKESEDFLLAEEVSQSIEGLSVSLNQKTSIKFNHDYDGMPDKVNGDLQKFKLAVQTVAEFSIKYSKEGQIAISTHLEKLTDCRAYMMRFQFAMSINKEYDEKSLFKMINQPSQYSQNDHDHENDLVQRYITFYEMISIFGIGMVIFPSIIQCLGGNATVAYAKNGQTIRDDTTNDINKAQAQPPTELKVQFTIPLAQAENETVLRSPYTQINKNKHQTGSQSIWKSPMLGFRKDRPRSIGQIDIHKVIKKDSFANSPAAKFGGNGSNDDLPKNPTFDPQEKSDKGKISFNLGGGSGSGSQSNHSGGPQKKESFLGMKLPEIPEFSGGLGSGKAARKQLIDQQHNPSFSGNDLSEKHGEDEEELKAPGRNPSRSLEKQKERSKRGFRKSQSISGDFLGTPTNKSQYPPGSAKARARILGEGLRQLEKGQSDSGNFFPQVSCASQSSISCLQAADKAGEQGSYPQEMSFFADNKGVDSSVNTSPKQEQSIINSDKNEERKEAVGFRGFAEDLHAVRQSRLVQKQIQYNRNNMGGGNQGRGLSEEPKRLDTNQSAHGDNARVRSQVSRGSADNGFGASQVNVVEISASEFDGNSMVQEELKVEMNQAERRKQIEQNGQVFISDDESFYGLENFGSFVVSESFNEKICETIKSSEKKPLEQAAGEPNRHKRKAMYKSFKEDLEKKVLSKKQLAFREPKGQIHNMSPLLFQQDLRHGASRQLMNFNDPNRPVPNSSRNGSVQGLLQLDISDSNEVQNRNQKKLIQSPSVFQKLPPHEMNSFHGSRERVESPVDRVIDPARRGSLGPKPIQTDQSDLQKQGGAGNSISLLEVAPIEPADKSNEPPKKSRLAALREMDEELSAPKKDVIKSQELQEQAAPVQELIKKPSIKNSSKLSAQSRKSQFFTDKFQSLEEEPDLLDEIPEGQGNSSGDNAVTQEVNKLRKEPVTLRRLGLLSRIAFKQSAKSANLQQGLKCEDSQCQHGKVWKHGSLQMSSEGQQSSDQQCNSLQKGGSLLFLPNAGEGKTWTPNKQWCKQKQFQVLIVEDNAFSIQFLVANLTQMNVKFMIAENGQEAVDIVSQTIADGHLFDLILMDIIMPVLDGFQASRQIRQIEDQNELDNTEKHFICGCSADVNAAIEKKANEHGLDMMLSKPMSKETLENLLEKHNKNKLRKASAQNDA